MAYPFAVSCILTPVGYGIILSAEPLHSDSRKAGSSTVPKDQVLTRINIALPDNNLTIENCPAISCPP